MATLSSVRMSFTKSLNLMRWVVLGEYEEALDVGLLNLLCILNPAKQFSEEIYH